MLNNLRLYFLKSLNKRQYCSYKPIKRPDLSLLKKEVPTDEVNASSTPATKEGETTTPEIDLSKELRNRILATGPISVADYMREVLRNPLSGYYMKRDVFGQEGDFVTSPEICQIFAELIAIWFIHEWQKIGSPEFRLIEFGPGRGTLMRDILRVLGQFQIIDRHRTSIHLIEISPFLSELQAECLCSQYSKDNNDADSNNKRNPSTNYYQKGETINGKIPIYWHQLLEDVPTGFALMIAHEFFDALPIHKFEKANNNLSNSKQHADHWKEILIDVKDPQRSSEEIEFRYILSREQTPTSSIFQSVPEDSRKSLEYSFEMERIIDLMSNRLQLDGGISLVIDYGHVGEKTDTFRAFRRHALHDPLKNPGTADLTADVDFQRMKYVAERDNRCICFGPVEQGVFLDRMQGPVRLENLLKNAKSEEQRNHLKSAYDMLTKPEQMGSRFKFFSMFPSVLKEYLHKYPVIGFNN